MPGSALLLAAVVALATPAEPPAVAGPARVSALASVTVLTAGRAGERGDERQAWRSQQREAGQVLTCFE